MGQPGLPVRARLAAVRPLRSHWPRCCRPAPARSPLQSHQFHDPLPGSTFSRIHCKRDPRMDLATAVIPEALQPGPASTATPTRHTSPGPPGARATQHPSAGAAPIRPSRESPECASHPPTLPVSRGHPPRRSGQPPPVNWTTQPRKSRPEPPGPGLAPRRRPVRPAAQPRQATRARRPDAAPSPRLPSPIGRPSPGPDAAPSPKPPSSPVTAVTEASKVSPVSQAAHQRGRLGRRGSRLSDVS